MSLVGSLEDLGLGDILQIVSLSRKSGLLSIHSDEGEGRIVFCDGLVHSSPPNLSPWDRRIFSLIVNPVANAYTTDARPDWKHHRDLTPIEPLTDDCLRVAVIG